MDILKKCSFSQSSSAILLTFLRQNRIFCSPAKENQQNRSLSQRKWPFCPHFIAKTQLFFLLPKKIGKTARSAKEIDQIHLLRSIFKVRQPIFHQSEGLFEEKAKTDPQNIEKTAFSRSDSQFFTKVRDFLNKKPRLTRKTLRCSLPARSSI